MKILVLFAHDRESGPWDAKIKHLADIAESRHAQVLSPDCSDLVDPDARVARLCSLTLPSHDRLVMVGCGLGGYVATVASRALKPDGLFLIGPELYMLGFLEQDPTPCARHIHITHGASDKVVPQEHSHAFVRKHGGFVHVFESDHELNNEWAREFLGTAFEDFLRRASVDPGCTRNLQLERIVAEFASDFAWWGIRLPMRDVLMRRPGSMGRGDDWENFGGWDIRYLFGAKGGIEYLDYYASHRMTSDSHVRIHGTGAREDLPALAAMFVSADDPDEAKC